MSPRTTDVAAAAADLIARGFALCRPNPGTKNPTDTGWSVRSLPASEFGPDDMIGIMGGALSDGGRPGHSLVIVDLDRADAIELADRHLPATGMAEGRPGKERSHRYYLVPNDTIPEWAQSPAKQAAPFAREAKGHPGPFKKALRDAATKAVVIDFIGTGGQVVAPPSLHPSGEARGWEGGEPGEPRVVHFGDLWRAVCRLGQACSCKSPSNCGWPWADRPTTVGAGRATRPAAGADVEERAARYLDRCPEAVSGQAGHDATMWAARCVAWGFDLGADVAFRLLSERYNPRCRPPWSDAELRHKCEDADEPTFDKPRGWLRDAPRPERNGAHPPGPANGKPAGDVIAQATAYLDRVIEAIPGAGPLSNKHLDPVAEVLVGGFGLDSNAAYTLLSRHLIVPHLPYFTEVSVRHWCARAEGRHAVGRRGRLLGSPDPFRDWPLWWVKMPKQSRSKAPGPKAQTPARLMLSDVGNAARFVAAVGDRVRYVDDWSQWLIWDGRRWKRDATREIEDLAKQVAVEMFNQAAADVVAAGSDEALRSSADANLRHAKRSLDAPSIMRMIALARSNPAVGITPDVLDADPWALNVLNGTVDLRTGELRPHRQGDRLTKLCPTRFDEDARCPTWQAFVTAIFAGDAELAGFVQRLMGYGITGDVSEQILAIFHGGGANGKSTFLEAVMDVVGPDYCMKATQDLLMVRKHEGHPTERADLRGKRLVAAVETDGGMRLSESLVKELTGSDRIRARRLYENNAEFAPTHKLFLATNCKPRVAGTDGGTWRRLRLVPFAVRFWNPDDTERPGERRPADRRADKDIRAKLLAEREGILAWLVAGCLEWRRAGGLGMPPAVAKATSDYREGEDLASQFLDEKCARVDNHQTKASDLYGAFKRWCAVEGIEDVPSQRAFGETLTAAGFERFRSNGMWYRGVQMIDDGGTLSEP